MSGMLGRAPANVPALVSRAEAIASVEVSKRFCAAWPPRVQELLVEPTSVLDIRSPSPSSTLSSSVAGSTSEGAGQQLSTDSGGAVAVSGRVYEGTSAEGQLLDCTSLLEGGNESGSVWGVEAGDHGAGRSAAAHGTVDRTWQSTAGFNQSGWERNVEVQDRPPNQHVEGPPGLMKELVGGYLPRGNVGASINAEKFVVGEAAVDKSVASCVIPCRKRDRADSLGEVVQQLCTVDGACTGGRKAESEWLSDWNDFSQNANAALNVGSGKITPHGQMEDFDEIFSNSPPAVPAATLPAGEFWPAENFTPSSQQVLSNESARAVGGGLNSVQSSKAQLDLFEALQAGLVCRGGGIGARGNVAGGATGHPSSIPSTGHLPNMSPSIQVLSSRPHSVPFNSSVSQPFPLGGSALPRQYHRHPVADSTSPNAAAFMPALENKPLLPSPSLLSATFTPSAPQFPSQLQFQDLVFPLPLSYKRSAPQTNYLSFPRPEYRPPPQAEYVNQRPWQMRMLEGDAGPKAVAGGQKWQLNPEPGWQPGERFSGPGHPGGLHLSPRLPMPVEPPSQRQAAITMPEHGGRSVRLEELSLAERLLSTAMEMAQLGDLSSVQAILARLNQQVPLKGQQLPSQRVIPLFVDALAKWVSASSPSAPSRFQQHSSLANSPLDLIKKISAYKKFCEVSPISQFAHFTANQAILDAIEGEDHVHLIDFELGFGGQWASFMQELSQRCRGPPELKITTMGTDTLETKLAKENLLQFATEMGIKLEVNVVPLEKLEFVRSVVANKASKEAVAVNFGFAMNRMISDFASMEEVLSFLQLVKTLCPKVIAVMDSECEFDGPSGLSEALQFYSCILESLDASTKLSAEVVSNIEGLVLGPKIAELVTARLTNRSSTDGGALPQWRILLQKVGFSPCPFSSAAESQASWLVNNPLNLGFTYSKQQATLFLGWYNKTLVSASAWGP